MDMIFGSEGWTCGKVRESTETMGEATNGGHEFDPGGTHNQCSSQWSGKVLFNS